MADGNNDSPSTSKSVRLNSLLGKRDLTTPGGGRKQFTPNLAAAGKRLTPSIDPARNDNSKRGGLDKKLRGDFQKRRNAGDSARFNKKHIKEEPRIVESAGIFMGMGPDPRSKSAKGNRGGGDGGGGSVRKSNFTILKNEKPKTELDEEGNEIDDEVSIKKMLAESIIAISEPDVVPIDLPMNNKDSRIKDEDHLAKFFMDSFEAKGSNRLIFFQLPSILSESVSTVNDKVPQIKTTGPNGDDVMKDVTTGDDLKDKHALELMPEGKIGKLQFLKSGKMRMVIGNQSFEVRPGSQTNFLQEIVSIDSSSKQMYSLGRISDRLLVTPSIETLFQQKMASLWSQDRDMNA